jgi:hypothetical protein
MDAHERIRIEVICAWSRRYVSCALELPVGATVADALSLAAKHPDFAGVAEMREPTRAVVAVFGERAAMEDLLSSGDRIEVLRPLLADPKDARRRRAKKA